ncbi:endospore germination permease [Aneurinibacillus sp. Ricciae_BoGa-3]|uniref:GerAB/ArcD/ProY family transporter n=1 Tax=Aneurinibacillus sp. Ricciae_BoGa-3 TaxID=3022697 RepID=UPI002341B153|nr:endospore germination permease [Aneurinibacillus sp. Ricciae_BoGa-3]WCK55631.1 endospore germination permease [Aneurinibacillus sp. Ricciae_BoGa-3]
MRRDGKNEISLLQYILTIHSAQIGYGVLTLPRELEQVAGTDGWISVIIGWAITTLVSLCIVRLMAKHPGDTLYDLLTRYTGKWMGKAGIIIWILYYLLASVSLAFSIVFVIRLWILPKTPDYALMLLFIIPGYMLIRGGIRIISRYAVFVFFFTLWLAVVILIPLKNSHWVYLLPVLKEGWMPVLYAVKTTSIAFLGFELAFIIYPYLKNKQSASKGIVIANTLTLMAYLLITLVCFVYFSPTGISEFLWPTLTLVKPIHFPFLERFEIVFLSFYLFVFSTSAYPYVFSATYAINQLFNKTKWQLPTFILQASFVLILIFYTPSIAHTDALREWWGVASYFVAYAFPVVFLLYVTGYTYLKGRKAK